MINPVSFDEIVRWLKSKKQPLWIDKLGRRSRNGVVCHFFCYYEPKTNTILVAGDEGLKGNRNSIDHFDKTKWDAVMRFMQTLNPSEREMTTRYSNTNIPEVNMVFRSNPPAICRAYWEEKGGIK